jgi:predicted transcriptional regulator
MATEPKPKRRFSADRKKGADGLTNRQREAVRMFAIGMTNQQIADALDVSEPMVSLYRSNPIVRAAVLHQQAEVLQADISQTVEGNGMLADAIRVCHSILMREDESSRDRIAAAKVIVGHAAVHGERKMLERQIANLELKLFNITVDPGSGETKYLPPMEEAE